jgi:hypothetical protein
MDVWLHGIYPFLDWNSLGRLCTVSKQHNTYITLLKKRYMQRFYPPNAGNLEFALDRLLYQYQFVITHRFVTEYLHVTRKQLRGKGRLHYRHALRLCLERHGNVHGWKQYKNYIFHKRTIEKNKWRNKLN